MVLETLAILSGVKDVFMYNRQSYQFNKTVDQERLYHLQKMRIEQVKLFREDIRDLFNLVISKMNNYYLVNTLALGFSLGFYYEGKVPKTIPSWLYWLWMMSLASAIVYLFLSVWFAVHASVVAQMFSARLLTQWLRLPVPGPAQINPGAPKLEEYENESLFDSLRIPVISKPPVVSTGSNGESGSPYLDPPTTLNVMIQEGYNHYVGHFYMFARLQKHWMLLDAYCRVCMVLGCNQILNAVTYTGLAYFALYDNQWGTLAFCVIPIVFACVHVHMNILLSKREAIAFLTIHSLAPIFGSIAAGIQMVYVVNDASGNAAQGGRVAQAVALASYVCHLISWICTTRWGLEINPENGLPTRFTTVNYIDILGLLKKQKQVVESFVQHSSVMTTVLAKQELPVDSVIPAAHSIRVAEKEFNEKYSKLEEKQLNLTNRHPLNSFSSQGANGGQRASILAAPFSATSSIGSDKNELLPPNRIGKRHSFFHEGDHDHVPPDIIATMPIVAFRSVGVAVIVLWVFGIMFGAMSISNVPYIGWNNELTTPAGSNGGSSVSV